MNSAWPICRLVRPSATSASTSASRWVRPSPAAGEDADLVGRYAQTFGTADTPAYRSKLLI
jgi:hypothetical protein